MPVEIKRYRCEGCGTEFDSEISATECEDFHKVAVEFEESEYTKSEAFPHAVNIRFDNGTCFWYYRNRSEIP